METETLQSIRPLLALLVSLVAVPLIITARTPNIRDGFSLLAAIAKFAIVASMVPFIVGGGMLEFTIAEVLPSLAIKLRVDALGVMFALVSSFLWIITTAYSIGYMRALKEHSQTRFACFFALSLTATIGVAFSANLLTLYLFYEMLSLATYPLVTHHQDKEARVSGRKYLAILFFSSIGFLLPAMIYTYSVAGTLEFQSGGILQGSVSKTVAVILLLCFTYGFAKAAIMPLHAWLPAAMVAPTPVSALLHAVAVVKVGVFCIVRAITEVFGVEMLGELNLGVVVCILASITTLVSSLIALSQDSLKRRLAFSTIGQLSYIVLGAALLSGTAVTGGILHIAMHSFGKITLFFCAGAVYVALKVKNVSQMTGIGRKMPVTMAAFFVGSLSVIGLPPCGGFISKWLLVLGALEAKQTVFLVVLLLSSFLNGAYFLPIVYRAFFCTDEESNFGGGIKEAPPWCLAPLALTALISMALFFMPQPFLDLARLAVRSIVGGP